MSEENSAERYLKQAIESEVFSDKDWKSGKAKLSMEVNLRMRGYKGVRSILKRTLGS